MSAPMRLDKLMLARGLVETRSQAENWIRLGRVSVQGRVVTKAGHMVPSDADVRLEAPERYVSRAGLKLASVAGQLGMDFQDKLVLDVGSSTGGFTDYALQHGARRVIAVDVGTEQLHPSLRDDPRIELHEKTDIRDFMPGEQPDIVVMDVSFVSARQILPHLATIIGAATDVLVMVKPQFEARRDQLTRGGIVKNDRHRRDILGEFEKWVRGSYVIADKADSAVSGAGGNQERFYLLRRLKDLKN